MKYGKNMVLYGHRNQLQSGKSGINAVGRHHENMVRTDAINLIAYSPCERQKF